MKWVRGTPVPEEEEDIQAVPLEKAVRESMQSEGLCGVGGELCVTWGCQNTVGKERL